MSYNRPLPPHWYDEAHQSQVIDSTNDNNVRAGKGITLTKTTYGTTIHAKQQSNPNALNYTGPYSFSASYVPNDVAYVDPTVTYYDQTGSVIPFTQASGSSQPPLCAGLFVCVNPVPPLGVDDALLTGSVAPAYEAAGQTICSEFADSFRHYSLNWYFPFWPNTSSATWVAESTWTTVQNQQYWAPLCIATGSSGGGIGYQMVVISEQSSSLACVYATSSASGTSSVSWSYSSTTMSVAKPPELRGYIATSSDSQGNTRTILPPYLSGSIIYAIVPVRGTGVTVSSSLLTYQDVNASGRQWATSIQTCETISGSAATKHRYFVCSTYF